MTMTLPDLDDRSFDALIDEARSVLAIHAPGWTNHNASDPGITLIELLAWVSEQLLFRLNLVGLQSKRRFLDLLRGRSGSRDAEASDDDVDEAIRREVVALARPRRAVTTADFESIALDATQAVTGGLGRACCVDGIRIDRDEAGLRIVRRAADFTVVVVPSEDRAADDETLEAVHQRLAPACLLGSRVHVVPPIRVQLAIDATIATDERRPADEWRRRCRDALDDRFSPWARSAANPSGWPFGRPVFLADAVEALESVDGVDEVSKVRFAQAAMRSDAVERGDAPIGIQLGIESTVGTTTRFGAQIELGPDRLIRGSDGRLLGFALRPYELVEVVLPDDALTIVANDDTMEGDEP